MITNQAVVSVVCQHIHELTANFVTIMLLLFSLLGKLVGKAIIFCRIFFYFSLPREAMLSAVFAVVVVCVCVCVCVCVSVTLRYSIKTAKRRITQTTPHDSPMILVF